MLERARSTRTVCCDIVGLRAVASSAGDASCSHRQMAIVLQKWQSCYWMDKGIGTLQNLSLLGCYIPELHCQKLNSSSALWVSLPAISLQYPDLGVGTWPIWWLHKIPEQLKTWTLPCFLQQFITCSWFWLSVPGETAYVCTSVDKHEGTMGFAMQDWRKKQSPDPSFLTVHLLKVLSPVGRGEIR